VRYFNGILFVFTLVFLKCAHYSTDFVFLYTDGCGSGAAVLGGLLHRCYS